MRMRQLLTVMSGVGTLAVTTTSPGETLTIQSFGVAAGEESTIFWGDGQSDTYTGTAQRTHVYADAGTYSIRITNQLAIETLDLRDAKLTVNSRDLREMGNIQTFRLIGPAGGAGTFNSADVSSWSPTTFEMRSMPAGYAGTFDSADVSSWSPTEFQLFSMPAGYAGTFDSADVSSWSPTTFNMFNMPSGYAGTFDSADVSSWSPTTFQLFSMPSGYAGTFDSTNVSSWSPTTFVMRSMPSGYAGTFDSADVSSWSPTTFEMRNMPAGYAGTFDSADVSSWSPTTFQMRSMPGFTSWAFGDADFNGWSNATGIYLDGNSLTQAQVDTILFSIYGIGASRSASNGTINVGGNNAAPSGTFQAAVSCPVDTNTPGKEVAHELLNDGCALGFNVWATVTYTA